MKYIYHFIDTIIIIFIKSYINLLDDEQPLMIVCYEKQDLDNETLLHIDAENRRQTLEEEIEFIKSVHEQVRTEFLDILLTFRYLTAQNCNEFIDLIHSLFVSLFRLLFVPLCH